MNKRGQFFIIAAIIIIGLVISLTTAVNSINVRDSNKAFYDLADEVGFETKRVLDYGVFKEEDSLQLTESFLETYANYIAQEQVVFIYGDTTNLRALFFEEVAQGGIGINTGTQISSGVTITDLEGREAEVSVSGGIVFVEVNGIIYDFTLKEGQNFFLIIIKEEDGEKFVAKK